MTAVRWYDFLSLFVARRLPALLPSTRALAPLLYQTTMGISGVAFPGSDPIEDERDYGSALAAFEGWRAVHTAELEALRAEEWERSGVHEEFGPLSITDHTLSLVWHDAIHAAQIGQQLLD